MLSIFHRFQPRFATVRGTLIAITPATTTVLVKRGNIMEIRTFLKRFILGWIILAALVALLGDVSVAETDNGRTAADFLLIGAGARSAAMGGAFTAVAEGLEASYWNPAGLAQYPSGGVSFSHYVWYQDITVDFGAVAFAVGEATTLAASITYLNYGDIEGFDNLGNSIGSLDAYDWAGAISIGHQLNDNLMLGITGKFINQQLDDINGTAFAGDVAVIYDYGRFRFAAMAANIGTDIDFDGVKEKLPALARAGVAARPFGPNMTASLELEQRLEGDMIVRNGYEIQFQDRYFIRGGYHVNPEADERAFGSGMSFGAGLRFGGFDLDYAYTPEEDYTSEDLHRFSVSFKFGQ